MTSSLITRRSHVQIVPPQPIKALSSKGFRCQSRKPFLLEYANCPCFVRVSSSAGIYRRGQFADKRPTSKWGALAADHLHVARGHACKRLAFGAEPLVSVLDTLTTVGECKSLLLRALDEFGRDAGIAELLCRPACLAATDMLVGAGWSVSVPCHKRQILRNRVLWVLVQPCGK